MQEYQPIAGFKRDVVVLAYLKGRHNAYPILLINIISNHANNKSSDFKTKGYIGKVIQ
jgi:hypothetical protein